MQTVHLTAQDRLKRAKSIHDVSSEFVFDNGDSDGVWTPESLDAIIPDLRPNSLRPAEWEIPTFMQAKGCYWLCWEDSGAILAHDASGCTMFVKRKSAPQRDAIARIIDRLPKDQADKFVLCLENGAASADEIISLLDC